MNTVRESALYRLAAYLWAAYGESALYRNLSALGRWCLDLLAGSRFLALLGRRGTVSAAWPESRTCRAVTWLLTLPGRALHRWYTAWQAVFEGSVLARFAFALGEGTAVAESWLIMGLWVIPFAYWDNAWSLGAFLFLLLLFHAGAMRRREFRLDAEPIGVYPWAFFLTVALALVQSWRPELSVRFFGYHLAAAACVLVTVSAVRNASDLKRLCAGGTVVAAAASLYGVYTRFRGVRVNIAYVDAKLNPDMPGRVQSYFDNPNTFAEVLVLLLPMALALVLCAKRPAARAAAGLAWLTGLAALLMTYSRAAWLGFALSTGLILLLLRPKVVPAAMALCVGAVPFLPSAVWTRILTIVNFNDTTTSSRFPLYDAALALIRRAPLTGAGLGSDAVRRYIGFHRLYHGTAPFVHGHNLYLQIWMEMGFFGLAAFAASLIWGVKRGFLAARSAPDSPAGTVTCCAAAGMCGIALCAMADYPWHYPRVMVIFWFLFALLLAGTKVLDREAASGPDTARPAGRTGRRERPRRERVRLSGPARAARRARRGNRRR